MKRLLAIILSAVLLLLPATSSVGAAAPELRLSGDGMEAMVFTDSTEIQKGTPALSWQAQMKSITLRGQSLIAKGSINDIPFCLEGNLSKHAEDELVISRPKDRSGNFDVLFFMLDHDPHRKIQMAQEASVGEGQLFLQMVMRDKLTDNVVVIETVLDGCLSQLLPVIVDTVTDVDLIWWGMFITGDICKSEPKTSPEVSISGVDPVSVTETFYLMYTLAGDTVIEYADLEIVTYAPTEMSSGVAFINLEFNFEDTYTWTANGNGYDGSSLDIRDSSFLFAVEQEQYIMHAETQAELNQPTGVSFNADLFNYLTQGQYEIWTIIYDLVSSVDFADTIYLGNDYDWILSDSCKGFVLTPNQSLSMDEPGHYVNLEFRVQSPSGVDGQEREVGTQWQFVLARWGYDWLGNRYIVQFGDRETEVYTREYTVD